MSQKRSLKNGFKQLVDEPAELAAETRPSTPQVVSAPPERKAGRTPYSEADSIVALVKAEQSTATFDQEYSRRTLYLREDVNDAVNDLAKKYPKGFKTRLVNYAIAKVLREEFDITL